MHVVIVSADCIPNLGGIASHVRNLALHMRSAGVDVTVLGGSNQAEYLSGFKPPFDGFEVKRIPGQRIIAGFSFVVWARKRLRAIAMKKPVDVVHVHTLPTDTMVLPGLSSSIARVATIHSSAFHYDTEYGRRKAVHRMAFGLADNLIAVSQVLHDKCVGLGVNEGKVLRISNGVDTEFFRPGEHDARAPVFSMHDIPVGKIILVTKRLVEVAGITYMLRAMPFVLSRVKDAVLVIAGEGDQNAALRQEAHELGVSAKVRFLGRVPNSNLMDLYRSAAICVLPSLVEATSISCLEAMACGKPIVASGIGGLPELVEDGLNGKLCPPRDSGALASACIELLVNPDQALRMGRASRARAEKEFSWKTIVDRILRVYESTLDMKARTD